ncbi:MAG: VTT domain-containing protein [Candidatus Levybacteria bacterium]|nr:VTT domain-containing protein [Candidatus Levybacteria bacterium]
MQIRYFLIFTASTLFIFLALVFQENLSQFKSLGLVGIFLINFLASATIFLPAPGIASVVAGGVLYPPVLVAIVSALGASAGDMVGFVLGHAGRKIFIKNHHRWYMMLKDKFKMFGDVIVFLFAFVPNPLFDAIGILAGVFAYSPVRFFMFMLAGRFIRNVLLAYLGNAFAP